VKVDYSVEPSRQLTMGLAMRSGPQAVRLQPLGRGGYVEIAKAYRVVARARGFLKTLTEKRLKSSKHIQMYAGFGDRPPTWNAKAVTLKP